LILMCVGLYAVFLAIQTTRHRSYFIVEGADEIAARERAEHLTATRSTALHAGLLLGLSAAGRVPRRRAGDRAEGAIHLMLFLAYLMLILHG